MHIRKLKILSYAILLAALLLFVAMWILSPVFGIRLSVGVLFYLQVFDILISLLGIYILSKWFKIGMIKRIFSYSNSMDRNVSVMSVSRLIVWFFLYVTNVFIWIGCGVDNLFYVIVVLLLFSLLLVPLDSNLSKNKELLNC